MEPIFEELCDESGEPVVTVCRMRSNGKRAVGISIRSLDDDHTELGQRIAQQRAERALRGRSGCKMKIPQVYASIGMLAWADFMRFMDLVDGVIKGHEKGWLAA